MVGKFNTVGVGTLFLLDDQDSKDGRENTRHCYFVLGGAHGVFQCMHCTSLSNKSRRNEVPVLWTNSKVSYIVVSKIFTRMGRDFVNCKYMGTMTDGTHEFIELLLDLHTDSLGMHPERHDDVMRRYEKYCKEFFDNLPDTVSSSAEAGYQIVIPPEVIQQVKADPTPEQRDPEQRDSDAFKAMIHKHPKFWETAELEKFVKIMDTHKNDTKFKMEFLEVSSPQSVHQKVYLARKELKSRRTASENFESKFEVLKK